MNKTLLLLIAALAAAALTFASPAAPASAAAGPDAATPTATCFPCPVLGPPLVEPDLVIQAGYSGAVVTNLACNTLLAACSGAGGSSAGPFRVTVTWLPLTTLTLTTATFSISSLAPGESKGIYYGFAPWSCGLIVADVDLANAVDERNESNNSDAYDRGPRGINGLGCYD